MPLPLPKGLIIDRDLEEEKDLIAKSRTYLEKSDRSGIHMSDLLDVRLAYFKHTHKSPIPDRLLNMFLIGQVAHSIIEVVKGSEDAGKSDAGTRLFEGIQYSPDFFNEKGEPDEIKTTRSFYPPKAAYLPDDDTFHMYLEQLLGYMAAEDKTVGRLTILYLNMKDETGKTNPTFYVWKVETTTDALAAMRGVLIKNRTRLETALETKDFSGLPLCRAWKCKDCEYFPECKPEGRFGVPEKEWLKRSSGSKQKSASK